jgi:hypothetical protein
VRRKPPRPAFAHIDRVTSPISFVLPVNVEALTLTGAGDRNGFE